jgi:hypothetical protein
VRVAGIITTTLAVLAAQLGEVIVEREGTTRGEETAQAREEKAVPPAGARLPEERASGRTTIVRSASAGARASVGAARGADGAPWLRRWGRRRRDTVVVAAGTAPVGVRIPGRGPGPRAVMGLLLELGGRFDWA